MQDEKVMRPDVAPAESKPSRWPLAATESFARTPCCDTLFGRKGAAGVLTVDAPVAAF
ncbi:hypothetical protein roselon_03128 [Roseibacterium elongatum DSM 19469]|uniref:Uncharacterized protein n=1 Tax=Roseicyclus elongatus DSM 19469 TaxID=1294273 RepID=W8RW47_9RHOB|nr:hypothetical protein roselon_03128 [Roseibacterium elongatum DSM 19469]